MRVVPAPPPTSSRGGRPTYSVAASDRDGDCKCRELGPDSLTQTRDAAYHFGHPMAKRSGPSISVKMILTSTVLILVTVVGFGVLNVINVRDVYDTSSR